MTAFRVERPGPSEIALFGVIDEHADLSFFRELSGLVRINLRGVRRINSFGVRSWIDAVRKVPEGAHIEFFECPPPVVDQMNMVSGFFARGRVVSFYAPMACDDCGVEEDRLFQVADCKARGNKLSEEKCPECGKPMDVDDLEDQYLLFLKDA